MMRYDNVMGLLYCRNRERIGDEELKIEGIIKKKKKVGVRERKK